MTPGLRAALVVAITALALAGPWLAPAYVIQLTMLWVMILFALTWDIMGGQMGYNSFGNVVFFGVGMYVCVTTQIGLYVDLGEYAAAFGAVPVDLDAGQYFAGLGLGLVLAPMAAVALAALLGSGILGLRGHYFAIATLAVGIAGGEIAGGWRLIGAGSGLTAPQMPRSVLEATGIPQFSNYMFYYACLLLAVATFLVLRRMYRGRFGLTLNAIRDDEDKAEAMGLRTTLYKSLAWCTAAFFLAISGGLVGNLLKFIDPRDTAFAGATFGVWMVLMAILGGKGTMWGPVIGATVFHVTQTLFWTWLLGWQRVALGVLIVVIVVFFPRGIMGWLREHWPERFGERVEEAKSP